jgi:hypothetical protein
MGRTHESGSCVDGVHHRTSSADLRSDVRGMMMAVRE